MALATYFYKSSFNQNSLFYQKDDDVLFLCEKLALPPELTNDDENPGISFGEDNEEDENIVEGLDTKENDECDDIEILSGGAADAAEDKTIKQESCWFYDLCQPSDIA